MHKKSLCTCSFAAPSCLCRWLGPDPPRLAGQYLGGAEDYHWGNTGFYMMADGTSSVLKCDATSPNCTKDMWMNQNPATELVDDIYYSANFCTRQSPSRPSFTTAAISPGGDFEA